MDERLRKELLRSELKERNNGKKIIRCKYRPKYPDSAEREYVRLINAYMTIEKEVLMKYIPEIKQILNDGTQLHTDSKKDNEKKRRTARFSALDNTIVRLTILFKTIQRELDSAFGLYDLKRQINRIANLDHKLTVREWKKAVSKTLGIDLLDDYYSGEYYAQMLEKWVSDNVDLIKTVPNQSLERMKELVYESYMKGSTTTNIVREIQRQYGMSKRHAKLIARDQTAKLNADITESQQRDSVKADVFGFDIADVSGSIRLFSDVMKRLGIKKDGDEMYEEFQKIYDESVGRDTDKKKVEDRTQNRG